MYMVRRSRTPQGVRGLKQWEAGIFEHAKRRTPQGVRGLKHNSPENVRLRPRRTPQGVRGLKLRTRDMRPCTC